MADQSGIAALIASEADLEAFCNRAIEERSLTEPLRGVLAETAVTGVVRYKWALVRPLLEFAIVKVMRDYDTHSQDDVGPSRYSSCGETVTQTLDRFKTLLSSFSDAPWTVQRLCELVLEPRKQYTQLHKVALAIEKCLLVTSEMAPSRDPPSVPLLSDLTNVNCNPPPVYEPAPAPTAAGPTEGDGPRMAAGAGALLKGREDNGGSGLFVGSMMELRGSASEPGAGPAGHADSAGPGQSNGPVGSGAAGAAAHHHGSHTGPMEHIEEDHWPENKPGLHPVLLPHHHVQLQQHHPQPTATQPPPQLHLPAPHNLLKLQSQPQRSHPPATTDPASTAPPAAGGACPSPEAAPQADATAVPLVEPYPMDIGPEGESGEPGVLIKSLDLPQGLGAGVVVSNGMEE